MNRYVDREPDLERPLINSQNYHQRPHSKSELILLSIFLNLATLGLLAYFILTLAKIDGFLKVRFGWSFTSFFIGFSLLSFCMGALYFLNIEEKKILNPGRLVLKVSITGITLFFLAFIILLSLKLDHILKISYGHIFIPLFVLLGIVFCILCFLFPALIDKENNLLKETLLIVLYFVIITTECIIGCLKLENQFPWKTTMILDLIYIPLFAQTCFAIYDTFQNGIKKTYSSWIFIIICAYILTLSILKIDKVIKIPTGIILLPIGLLLITIQIVSGRFFINAILGEKKNDL